MIDFVLNANGQQAVGFPYFFGAGFVQISDLDVGGALHDRMVFRQGQATLLALLIVIGYPNDFRIGELDGFLGSSGS